MAEGLGRCCRRRCNGVVLILCGLTFLVLSLGLIGWNEVRYVCAQKAVVHAELHARDVGCRFKRVWGFSFFSCPFVTSSLRAFDRCSWGNGTSEREVGRWKEPPGLLRSLAGPGEAAPRAAAAAAEEAPPAPSSTASSSSSGCASLREMAFRSVSGRREVAILHCKESCTGECKYELSWTDTPISSAHFRSAGLAREQCRGFEGSNPAAPAWLPLGAEEKFATEARVGRSFSRSITLNSELVRQLEPTNLTAAHYLMPGTFSPSDNCDVVGCVRIRYYQSPSTKPTVFAHVSLTGETVPATIPRSWGCSASDWQAIFEEPLEKQEALKRLTPSSTLCWGSIDGLSWRSLVPTSALYACGYGAAVMGAAWLYVDPALATTGIRLGGPICAVGMVVCCSANYISSLQDTRPAAATSGGEGGGADLELSSPESFGGARGGGAAAPAAEAGLELSSQERLSEAEAAPPAEASQASKQTVTVP